MANENTETSIWDNFTNMYSLSKTLRFELKPVGKTSENIKNSGLLEDDKKRSEDFKKVKIILDEFYSHIIEIALNKVTLDEYILDEYYNCYLEIKKTDKTSPNYKQLVKDFDIINKKLMNNIYTILTKYPFYEHLFNKDILTKELPIWLNSKNRLDDLKLVESFDKWSTYFYGFFENRKNVFSKEEIATSLIYRIVRDNLPKYVDNLENYHKLKESYPKISFGNIGSELREELEGKHLDSYFTLTNFNNCLNQSGIDRYNCVIGGKFIENTKEKIKGINEYINLFSQEQKDDAGKISKDAKKVRRMKLVPLYKQILSDKKSLSFVLDKFEDDKQMILAIKDFSENLLFGVNDSSKFIFLDNFKRMVGSLTQDIYDFDKIYLKSNSLSNISVGLYGDHSLIGRAMQYYAEKLYPASGSKVTNKVLQTRSFWIKQGYHSIQEIESSLLNYYEILSKDDKLKLFKSSDINYNFPIRSYLSKMIITEDKKTIDIYTQLKDNLEQVKSLLSATYISEKKDLLKKDVSVELLKNYLESVKHLINFMNPLYVEIKRNNNDVSEIYEKDNQFYGDFDVCFSDLKFNGNKLYDKVRNYVTQKSYSVKKFKLNFDDVELLKHWPKEEHGILLKQNNNYYLAIPKNSKIIKELKISPSGQNDCISLVNYNQSKAGQLIQNLMFINGKVVKVNGKKDNSVSGNARLEDAKTQYLPKEINEIRINKTYGAGKNFVKDDLVKFIDYYKQLICMYKERDFKFKQSSDYENFKDFTDDIDSQAYQLSFEEISFAKIQSLVDEGKLYLFKIWNKDFSTYSKGNKNLHTLYWDALFDENNLKNVVYKLNGEAELFYREKSIPSNITHQKDETLTNKDPIKGKINSVFKYDLIKDKRYSEDKYLFHCPITMNFKSINQEYLNDPIKKVIKNSNNINVLSLDRGERHLLYYTLLDSLGNICKQGTLNLVDDDLLRSKNYSTKLVTRESERESSRKNWKTIENIKELKEGYLSQVIHKLSNIAIENNAIIVLEDLNYGFKRGRFKVERQVYQKFEKMLIDKLNYFVFKGRSTNSKGGLFNAYQLTNKFKTFKELGKQSGIIFYVPASHTSKIDPKTGFVNLLYPKYETIAKSQEFFNKFKYIKYNQSEDMFEFNFNYSEFKGDDNDKIKLVQNNWSIWSNGIRLITKQDPAKNHNWITHELNLTEELKTLFKANNINYSEGLDLKENIVKTNKSEFFESLIYVLKQILKLRNSYTESEIENKFRHLPNFRASNYDYILSCVKDRNGKFFDSRVANADEPNDADANGAYNIGLKGLMLIDKIKGDNTGKPNLKIERDDFVNYVIARNK